MNQPVARNLLRGPRLQLSPLAATDAEALRAWFQDADFLRLLDAEPGLPWSETRIERWLKEVQESDSLLTLGLRLKPDDRLIGYAQLDGILWPHGDAGVALGIGRAEDRGQGYGAEAMRCLMAFAFQELGLHRLTATVFSYNAASIALTEGLGFQREGSRREFLLRDGQRFDMLQFGILRSEWATGSP